MFQSLFTNNEITPTSMGYHENLFGTLDVGVKDSPERKWYVDY